MTVIWNDVTSYSKHDMFHDITPFSVMSWNNIICVQAAFLLRVSWDAKIRFEQKRAVHMFWNALKIEVYRQNYTIKCKLCAHYVQSRLSSVLAWQNIVMRPKKKKTIAFSFCMLLVSVSWGVFYSWKIVVTLFVNVSFWGALNAPVRTNWERRTPLVEYLI